MENIVPLYLFAGVFAVAVSIPSIIQLIRTKRSDELSLFSWVGWLVYQVVALFYALYIEAWAYVLINILWIISYVIMVFLIIKYRKVPAKAKARVRKRKR